MILDAAGPNKNPKEQQRKAAIRALRSAACQFRGKKHTRAGSSRPLCINFYKQSVKTYCGLPFPFLLRGFLFLLGGFLLCHIRGSLRGGYEPLTPP